MTMNLCVFDIGGSRVKYGYHSDEGLTDQGSFVTPETFMEMKTELNHVLNCFRQEYDLDGVAFSAPGAVDCRNGVISGLSAVPYIHNFPIQKEFEELFHLPVSMENDANCAALAELHEGAAMDADNAIFMVIGSGIGGAVIIDRTLHRGRNLFGGEFGYMLIDGQNSLSSLGSPVKMAKRYATESGEKSVEGSEVFRLADEGEALAVKHVDMLIDALARGIFNLTCAFNPDKIIIGGGISKREDLIARLQLRTQLYMEGKGAEGIEVNIVPCRFRGDANLIGAAVHFTDSR